MSMAKKYEWTDEELAEAERKEEQADVDWHARAELLQVLEDVEVPDADAFVELIDGAAVVRDWCALNVELTSELAVDVELLHQLATVVADETATVEQAREFLAEVEAKAAELVEASHAKYDDDVSG